MKNQCKDSISKDRRDMFSDEKLRNIGDRLIKLRKERRLTQATVSEYVGLDANNYRMWEQGRRAPSFWGLYALSNLYAVSLDFLACQYDYKAIDGAAICDLTGLSDNALRILQSEEREEKNGLRHKPRIASTVSEMIEDHGNRGRESVLSSVRDYLQKEDARLHYSRRTGEVMESEGLFIDDVNLQAVQLLQINASLQALRDRLK